MATKTNQTSLIKLFNFEKSIKKQKKIRKQNIENLVRRAGGLKKSKDLKYLNFIK